MGQHVIVVTPSWDAIEGKLYRIEDGKQVGKTVAVVVGRAGMAWGMEGFEGEAKRESDGRSPAGIFEFGSVFGEEPMPFLKMPYIQTDETLLCVDDPQSRYYNRFVRKGRGDWNSAEKMKRDDHLYRYGIIVNYNTQDPVPYRGSCIFFHLWRSPDEGTAGCTAMQEEDLLELIHWLDPEKKPYLIQATVASLDALIAYKEKEVQELKLK